jgi:hypothetical protein
MNNFLKKYHKQTAFDNGWEQIYLVEYSNVETILPFMNQIQK